MDIWEVKLVPSAILKKHRLRTVFPLACSGEDLDSSLDTNELMQLIHMDNDVDNDNEDYEEVDTSASSLLSDMRFKVKSRDGEQQLENFIAKDR